MGSEKVQISALLITYNEIRNIREVLENLEFADEIIVVDSMSEDGTAEVVQAHRKAKLIQRPFVNFTDQKSFALDQATYDWVLFTDADERITTPLREEILEKLSRADLDIDAFYFKRKFMFMSEQVNFSGWQSDKNYRLMRKSKCRFDPSRIVHETLLVDGRTGTMENKLIHYSFASYQEYKRKMIGYGKMRAQEAYSQGKRYHFLLMVFRPTYKFLNHFVLRFGFLDGKKGLIISYLNALGVYARYKELKRLENQNKMP